MGWRVRKLAEGKFQLDYSRTRVGKTKRVRHHISGTMRDVETFRPRSS